MLAQQVKELVDGKSAETVDEATMTSQYVRLSLFVLVVVLAVSIAVATFRSGGRWEGSISDYFHTPARLALVGTMTAIGIGLMVLYSSSRAENVLLNVAGAFAPIIGFAATTQVPGEDPPFDFDVSTDDVDAFATTSLPAYFAALLLLAGLVYFVHKDDRLKKSLWAIAAVVVLALGTWITWEIDRRKVHVIAAVGFFVPLVILVFATAMAPNVRFKNLYLSIGILMVAAAVWYFVDRSRPKPSDHATFFVESVLVGCFAAFWLVEYVRIAPRTRNAVTADGER